MPIPDADPDPESRRGITDIARAILDHGTDYAEARIALAKFEAEEAGQHVRGISVQLGIGGFLAIAGYCILLTGGIALLAKHQLDGNWELPAIIVGVVHLIIGGLLLLAAKGKIGRSDTLFSSTRREFTKDKQWLKQKTTPQSDDPAQS